MIERGHVFGKVIDEYVPAPLSLDPELERDETILNNLKRMCEEAPSDEMKKIWEFKYNKFLETLKRKVTKNA